VEARLRVLGKDLAVLVGGVLSRDRGERLASWTFILSSVGALMVLTGGIVWAVRENRRQRGEDPQSATGKNLAQFLQQQADEAKQGKVMTVSLGLFTVELKQTLPTRAVETARKLGVVQAAELEVILECASESACEYLGKAMPQARSEVVSALVGLERDDLLSREGKRRIRKLIQERLNQWLSGHGVEGKVENVYLGRLVVG
jgi:flagellar basal body-associated protein FliL